MNVEDRIKILSQLGNHLLEDKGEYFEAVMHRAKYNNQWFTIENIKAAVKAIATAFLNKEKLENWAQHYHINDSINQKVVGIVMAGNIPLVGFHDFLSVFVAGHKAQIKLSDKDQYLLPYLLKLLTDYNADAAQYFEVVEKLQNFDAVIATGSNNTARYFDAYFGKYPHIIRRNRNAIAVLTGNESEEDFNNLSDDIFKYFGLGCRNVSKIYVPQGYDFEPLLEVLHQQKQLVLHSKYKNNFDFNYAIFMLNKETYRANGCIILKEDKAIVSRIACLHYEYYEDANILEKELTTKEDEIQCIVATPNVLNLTTLGFGEAQKPALMDYADGVDTIDFLLSIS